MIIDEAYELLFPGKTSPYTFTLDYSARFKGYNPNVRKRGRDISFHLSSKWKTVSKEIVIGLIQDLLIRILHERGIKSTMNIEMYHVFMQKIAMVIDKTQDDEVLALSYDRVNEQYFGGLVEKPNLQWHKASRRLGSYDYGTDTISMSDALRGAPERVLDYVMHHELLHKYLKYSAKGVRPHHHTKKFKEMEKRFYDWEGCEQYLSRMTRKGWFFFE